MPESQIRAAAMEGGEKRLTNRLMQCWTAAAPGGGLPTLDAILAQYVGDLWEVVFILEPRGARTDLCLTEIGEVFAGDLTGDLTGAPVSQVPEGTLLFQCTRNTEVALIKGRPAFFSGEYIDREGRIALYRSVLMPLRGAAENAVAILGAGWRRTEEAPF